MNAFSIFAAGVDTVWTRIALSLAHSLWVGAAIGVAALMLFQLLRQNRFHAARYTMLVFALLGIAVSPVLIFSALTMATASLDQIAQSDPVEVARNYPPLASSEETLEADGSSANRDALGAHTDTIVPSTPGDAVTGVLPKTTEPERDSGSIRGRRDVAKIAVALYGVIAVSLLTRLFLGVAGGTWLRRRSELVTDGAILGAAAKYATALGLRFSPAIAYCSRVAVPTVVGVMRPIILLPLSCATGMTPEQVQYLVLHELAHIRRYDHIVNLVQRVIEALMFYHPVVWMLSRQIRIQREQCCDDLVINLRGNAQQYAESLLAAASFASTSRNAVLISPATLSATGKASHLRTRIARILGEPAPAVRIRHGGWIAAFAVALCVLGGTQLFASNQEKDSQFAGQETSYDTNTDPSSDDSSEDIASEQPAPNIDTNLLAHEFVELASDLQGIQVSGMSIVDSAENERRILIEISVAPDMPINNFVEATDRIKDRATELVHERYGKNAALVDGKHLADDPISISITSMPTSTDTSLSGESMGRDIDTLYRQLRDKDWWLRKVAIQQLADSGADDIFESLIPLLKDEDERVQVAAANALGQLKAPESIPHLVAALKESRETSDAAAKALAQFQPVQVMPLIRMAAEDEDIGVQRGAIKALREVKTPETIELLINLLSEVPKGAVEGTMSSILRGRTMPILLYMRKDPLSSELARTFFELDPVTSSELVGRVMAHSDWRVRAGLMKVLAEPLFEGNRSQDVAVSPEVAAVLNREEVVQAQIRAMKDSQKDVRTWAATGLGLGARSLFDNAATTEMRRSALIAGLHDSNMQISRICGEFLVGENSVQLANDDDAIALMIARQDIEGLVTKREKALPALTAAMSLDFSAPLSDTQERLSNASEFLAEAFSQIGGPETVQPLIDLLKVANDNAKGTIAAALGNTGDSRGVEPLLQLVESANPSIQYAALESLGKLKDPRGFEPLSAALRSPNGTIARVAVDGLGNLGDSRAVAMLIDMLEQDIDDEVQVAAINALGKLGDRAAVSALMNVLKTQESSTSTEPRSSRNANARIATVRALGQLGGAEAVNALITALRTNSDVVRKEAANALGKLKDPAAMDPLVDAVQFDQAAREEAAKALSVMDSPESIKALHALYPSDFEGDNMPIAYHVISALVASTNPAADDALYVLLRDNRIPDGKVQLQAALSLAKHNDPRATALLTWAIRGNFHWFHHVRRRHLATGGSASREDRPGYAQTSGKFSWNSGHLAFPQLLTIMP